MGGIVVASAVPFQRPRSRQDRCRRHLRQLAAHIEHWLDLGGEDVIALGGDWDGATVPRLPLRCQHDASSRHALQARWQDRDAKALQRQRACLLWSVINFTSLERARRMPERSTCRPVPDHEKDRFDADGLRFRIPTGWDDHPRRRYQKRVRTSQTYALHRAAGVHASGTDRASLSVSKRLKRNSAGLSADAARQRQATAREPLSPSSSCAEGQPSR